MPVVSGIVAVSLSKLILPEFYLHVLERTKPMLSFDKIVFLIPQLFILAFGEEIAFRAFFQAKLSNILKPIWAIIIASLFFAIGHYSAGSILIVIYDLIFIFIDSIIYGIIFEKTKNVYSCAISHFLANLIGVCILLLVWKDIFIILDNNDKEVLDSATKNKMEVIDIENQAVWLIKVEKFLEAYSLINSDDYKNSKKNYTDSMNNALDSLNKNIEEKGLEFFFDVGTDIPKEPIGEPLILGQVLINLVGNAVKFTEKSKKIISIKNVFEDDREIKTGTMD